MIVIYWICNMCSVNNLQLMKNLVWQWTGYGKLIIIIINIPYFPQPVHNLLAKKMCGNVFGFVKCGVPITFCFVNT